MLKRSSNERIRRYCHDDVDEDDHSE
jgi:hypothetical protein